MTRWEYRTVDTTPQTPNGMGDLVLALDELGAEGWEAVAASTVTDPEGRELLVVVMKRESDKLTW